MELYRRTRQEAQLLLAQVKNSGYAEVCLQGDEGNDLVDVCRLTCLEQGIKIVSLKESSTLNPRNSRPVESYSYGATNPTDSTNPANVSILRVEGPRLTLSWPTDVRESNETLSKEDL